METSEQHIDPSDAQVQTLIAAAQEIAEPVVMVNLLAFNDEGGRESYLRYLAEVQPHLDRVGATVLYAGNPEQTVIGGSGDAWWDALLLVRYPSRAKFVEMALEPAYMDVARHRTSALRTSALIAHDEWAGELWQ